MENAFQHRGKVGVEDFVLLDNYTSEDAFLDNLRKRFQEDIIYTYIGNVLVSVNPYRELPLYDEQCMERYRGQNYYELPPHVDTPALIACKHEACPSLTERFAIADMAFRAVVHENRDECIMISGESGSGKTEASKKILQFIAQTSRHKGTVDDVKEKLLASNPLFEAFGNATTTRNENSSRFGKYMDIEVGVQGFPIGGHVIDYLLERTRVVFQAPGERNFHIFYQLLSGADAKLLRRLKLTGNWKDYYYLSQGVKSGTFHPATEDATSRRWIQEFRAVMEAFQATNFSEKERDDLFTTVAAILHLGNVQFEGEGDYAEMKSSADVDIASQLLGCSMEDLMQSLTHRGVHARQEKVLAKFNREQAITSRDSLAKAIYAKTFEWLVKRVNKALQPREHTKSAVIGLLDIYGFEIFESNSFEQFCINYCNEKLQQLFIELTMRSEQEEYVSENIAWEPVSYFDNQIICGLIESKPLGIIPLLDDECLRPGNADDQTFLEKLRVNHPKHPHLVNNRDKQQFTIKHYAGAVTYDVEGFMAKNCELLHRDLKEIVISCSNNVILKHAFTKEEAISLKRSVSTATQFKNSLSQLTTILKSKDPFYIRCIRPNDHKSPKNFSEPMVRHQVKYLGLLENLRVRRAGYAYRRDYGNFLRRYKSLCPETWPHFGGPPKVGVAVLMEYLQVSTRAYAMGVSKIFVRLPQTIFSIEDAFQARKHKLITMIIALWKGHQERQKYMIARHNIVTVQSCIRKFLAQRLLARRRRAAKEIRDFIRGFITRHGERTDANRKFWIQSRVNYLKALSKANLPKSVLDMSWPTSPPSMQETSELLRKLHLRNQVLRYCKRCSPAKKFMMEEKVLAERLFRDKKTLYPSSIGEMFAPSRITADPVFKDRLVTFESNLRSPAESTVYSTECTKWDRHGLKQRERAIIITTHHVYFLEPSKASFTKKSAFPLQAIEKVTVSSNHDSVAIVTIIIPANGKKPEVKDDYVFLFPRLIEFVTKLIWVTEKPDLLDIVSSGRQSLMAGNSNGCFVDFAVGNTDNILGAKNILIVQARG